jgi:hypothetical protein
MSLYCGIDLHSNNHVVVIIDQEDNKIVWNAPQILNHIQGHSLCLVQGFIN